MKKVVLCSVLSLWVAWSSTVKAEETGSTVEEWQLDLIYYPSASMLEREAKGFVFIYDGLSEDMVDKILDDRYDRIEYMMFTRVKKTDNNGDTMIDPETGDDILVDEGCD